MTSLDRDLENEDPFHCMKGRLALLGTFFCGLALFLLVGCAKDPLRKSRTDNPGMTVELLFTHEGCKVFRFSDYGEARYFVKCERDERVEWTHSESQYNAATKTTQTQEYPRSIETVHP